jgi:hypothetical protein
LLLKPVEFVGGRALEVSSVSALDRAVHKSTGNPFLVLL